MWNKHKADLFEHQCACLLLLHLSFSFSLVQWSSTCSDAREEIEDRASLTLRQSQWHHANCKYLIQMTCSERTTERSLPVSTMTRTTWAKKRRNLYAKKEWDYFSFSSIRTTTTARTTTARTIASSSSILIRVHSTTGREKRERERESVWCANHNSLRKNIHRSFSPRSVSVRAWAIHQQTTSATPTRTSEREKT